MSKHKHYVFGVSLGVGIQPTALAVLEHEVWKNEHWEPETVAHRLRYLERIPLDAGYPDTVERIDTVLKSVEIKDEECDETSDVILDITGAGRAPVELFERAEITPILVTISNASGREKEISPDDWHVPKIELVGNLQVLYQADRLMMAKGLALVPTLVDELRDFKMHPPRLDPSDPETWRVGQHDDLVFAVALAAWRASRHIPTPQVVRDHWHEAREKYRKKMVRYIV